MVSEREASAAIGNDAYGVKGGKLGTVEFFFFDDRTGAPSWVAISTGTRHAIVPAGGATVEDGRLSLPVTSDQVTSAPQLTGDHLSPEDEAVLRRHYRAGEGVHEEQANDVPVDGGSMTRSEEQLRVDTQRIARTRARLVKYVVTEEVQITVPIRREEIRVEEVPVDAPDPGPGESLLDDAELPDRGTGTGSGLPEEIVLHTERPVVTVEVVPTERVRLRTEVVQGQEQVTERVQREQIVVEQDVTSHPAR